MNILTEGLPVAVEIDGVTYDLNTDFRTGLGIMMMFEDAELTNYEKMLAMVRMLYKEVPGNVQKACELGVKFLNCGEEQKYGSGGDDGVGRLYSFSQDAKYIYSAILQSHGVDLEQIDYLHWWKFSYMFLDLKEECFFNRIICLRRNKALGKMTKEERELYSKIRDIIDLPMVYTQEEKEVEDEFMRLLNGN